jgi:hypothetical protein
MRLALTVGRPCRHVSNDLVVLAIQERWCSTNIVTSPCLDPFIYKWLRSTPLSLNWKAELALPGHDGSDPRQQQL